jgi:hypothetical protein
MSVTQLPSGARIIPTASFVSCRELFRQLTVTGEIGVVLGPTGTGKTFAATEALSALDLPHQLVRFEGTTPSQLLTQLFEVLTHDQPPLNTRLVRRIVLDQLSELRILVVDAADQLTARGRDLLFELHEFTDPHVALALIGDETFPRKLNGNVRLRERIDKVVPFESLAPEDVMLEIPRYHDLYADSDPRLILELDRDYARGNLHRWAQITVEALTHCGPRELTQLDRDSARLITDVLKERARALGR